MINNISSNYRINESPKINSNNNKNIENSVNNENNNIETKDKASFNTYKSSKAAASTEIFSEEREFINPIATSLATIFAIMGAIAGGSAYNPELYNKLSADLDKCKKFFDKNGMAGNIDFLGNISAPKEEKTDNK